MVLVLILLGILALLFAIFFLLLISTLKIKIKQFKILKEEGKPVLLEYGIEIGIYIWNKIRIVKFTITKGKKEKVFKFLKKFQKEELQLKQILKKNFSKQELLKFIKIADLKVEKLHLKIELDTEDVLLTTGLVGFIASILGIILGKVISKYDEKKYFYQILPVYQNKNMAKMYLDCIISIKVVHIIHIIYIVLKKERGEKDGRSSNRHDDDNCDEQYQGHDRCQYHYRGTN